jgi:hypothetical protein
MVTDVFEGAVAAHRAGDLDAAEQGYRTVLSVLDSDTAWANLGSIQSARGQFPEAEHSMRRAVQLRPDKAQHHYNLGNLFVRTRRLVEAEAAYGVALDLQPDLPGLKLNFGTSLLALGQFDRGWALYDHRPERQKTEARKLDFPEWRGEPLAGKRLFVWAEQGFGDQILASRFLTSLHAAEVTLSCRPELVGLFANLPIQVVARQEWNPVGPHDYWTLPLSIPRWVQQPLWNGPYLTGGSARARGGVGVAWRGNKLPDPGRSLPEEVGRRLLALPGAVSLHPEDSGARDFQDTADLIAGLDAVISIDTSVAHLAGAMGKPTWLLLQHYSADWRWEQPWYPSVRTVRQPKQDDWDGALRELYTHL